jgi:hypothetical protein
MTEKIKTVYLVASGDLRLPANQEGWPAQHKVEAQITAAFAQEGVQMIRAHAYDPWAWMYSAPFRPKLR